MDSCALEASVAYEDLVGSVLHAYRDDSQNYPWIVGFSGGKDSTLVAHLVFDAVMQVAPRRRNRQIYFVSNDTLVESPFVTRQVQEQFDMVQCAADCFSLPITTVITRPKLEHTFWVLLIGKGYPCPNQKMRWCTDRLKIRPTSKFILDNVSRFGSAIIVLGVRKDESSSRRQSIERHKNLENSYLTFHGSLRRAFIYRPIVELTTSDVWYILGHYDPPWGGTHEKLIQMYRDAEGGECPMVLSQDEAPGCGTSSSRFGCWACTVVNKDKSLQGFVNSGQKKYQLLIDFRDWLQAIRNDPTYRQARRRNGQLTFLASGRIMGGPFTLKARQEILQRLLNVQEQYGEPLISEEEIRLIRELWAAEIAKKFSGGCDE